MRRLRVVRLRVVEMLVCGLVEMGVEGEVGREMVGRGVAIHVVVWVVRLVEVRRVRESVDRILVLLSVPARLELVRVELEFRRERVVLVLPRVRIGEGVGEMGVRGG